MKTLCKPLSILLSILMVLSVFTLGTVAVSAADETPGTPVESGQATPDEPEVPEHTLPDVPQGYITVFFTDMLGWGTNLKISYMKVDALLSQNADMTFVETNAYGKDIYMYSFNPDEMTSFSFANPTIKNKTVAVSSADFKNGRGYYCTGDPTKQGPFSTYQLASYTYCEDPADTTAAPTTGPVYAPTYIVAGTPEFCGSTWDPGDTANQMTIFDDVCIKEYENVAPGTGYQIKVVKDGTEWFGDENGDNITFNVTTACTVTVTFNMITNEVTISGDGVVIPTELVIDSVHTAGNGKGAWLNGENWNPASDLNVMTETTPGVYSITYKDIAASDDYQVKFAANGSWTDNWGGTFSASGVWSDAVYNSSDKITLAVDFDLADVTITLDLSEFSYSTKTGAKFRVDIVDATPVVTDPIATEPISSDPVETDPVATEPISSDPVETDPVATDPISSDPVETDPVATDPISSDPVETDPVATDPISSDPVETDPIATDPISSDPVETEPAETQPPTTPDESSPDEFKIGDVDLDGKVTVKDATLIQKHVAGLSTLDAKQLLLAELDGDGKVSVKDATMIQKIVAGLIPAPKQKI